MKDFPTRIYFHNGKESSSSCSWSPGSSSHLALFGAPQINSSGQHGGTCLKCQDSGQMQEDLSEFKASLVYIESSKPVVCVCARTRAHLRIYMHSHTQWDPAL